MNNFTPGETVIYKRIVHMTQYSPTKKKIIDYHGESKKEVKFIKPAAWGKVEIEVRTPCGLERRIVKPDALEKKQNSCASEIMP